jgi:hypothetical protein
VRDEGKTVRRKNIPLIILRDTTHSLWNRNTARGRRAQQKVKNRGVGRWRNFPKVEQNSRRWTWERKVRKLEVWFRRLNSELTGIPEWANST